MGQGHTNSQPVDGGSQTRQLSVGHWEEAETQARREPRGGGDLVPPPLSSHPGAEPLSQGFERGA